MRSNLKTPICICLAGVLWKPKSLSDTISITGVTTLDLLIAIRSKSGSSQPENKLHNAHMLRLTKCSCKMHIVSHAYHAFRTTLHVMLYMHVYAHYYCNFWFVYHRNPTIFWQIYIYRKYGDYVGI